MLHKAKDIEGHVGHSIISSASTESYWVHRSWSTADNKAYKWNGSSRHPLQKPFGDLRLCLFEKYLFRLI